MLKRFMTSPVYRIGYGAERKQIKITNGLTNCSAAHAMGMAGDHPHPFLLLCSTSHSVSISLRAPNGSTQTNMYPAGRTVYNGSQWATHCEIGNLLELFVTGMTLCKAGRCSSRGQLYKCTANISTWYAVFRSMRGPCVTRAATSSSAEPPFLAAAYSPPFCNVACPRLFRLCLVLCSASITLRDYYAKPDTEHAQLSMQSMQTCERFFGGRAASKAATDSGSSGGSSFAHFQMLSNSGAAGSGGCSQSVLDGFITDTTD